MKRDAAGNIDFRERKRRFTQSSGWLDEMRSFKQPTVWLDQIENKWRETPPGHIYRDITLYICPFPEHQDKYRGIYLCAKDGKIEDWGDYPKYHAHSPLFGKVNAEYAHFGGRYHDRLRDDFYLSDALKQINPEEKLADYQGFFQLILIIPITDIRKKIFQFIGALIMNEATFYPLFWKSFWEWNNSVAHEKDKIMKRIKEHLEK